ncbi:hypothetical protein SESBI_25550 [Sesbania bispinosa]|nr:hypothetical protein SESBI_25550 [Sesbania bispinosa]
MGQQCLCEEPVGSRAAIRGSSFLDAALKTDFGGKRDARRRDGSDGKFLSRSLNGGIHNYVFSKSLAGNVSALLSNFFFIPLHHCQSYCP